MKNELNRIKNELNKLTGRIVGSNVLKSPLGFWDRHDTWREAAKGLEEAIKEMEEKCGHIGKNLGRDKGSITQDGDS